MNTRFALLPVLALTLSLAACSGSGDAAEPTSTAAVKTSVGGVVLVPADASAPAEACVPTADFADVVDGATIAITDADGTTLADGTLAAYSTQGENCALSFFIDDVARDKGTYTVAVTDHAAVTFTEDDLFAGGERRITLSK